jgi:hypothetical protein
MSPAVGRLATTRREESALSFHVDGEVVDTPIDVRQLNGLYEFEGEPVLR